MKNQNILKPTPQPNEFWHHVLEGKVKIISQTELRNEYWCEDHAGRRSRGAKEEIETGIDE